MYNKISRTLLENENKNRGVHTVFFQEEPILTEVILILIINLTL